MRRLLVVGLLLACCLCAPAPHARADGESINGYPNWSERMLLEWVNRARADPQADLANCPGSACLESACYTVAAPPRYLSPNLAHSARFHSSEMLINAYFSHPSQCTLRSNIGLLYPASCDGAASCACTQGQLTTDQSTWTDPFTRMGYFGTTGLAASEIIAAGYGDPNATFYGWEYEPTSSSTCGNHGDNGHRFAILSTGLGQRAGAGYVVNTGQAGAYSDYSTMDFAGTIGASPPKIPSGSHFPRQAASVDAWANWYASAGPSVARINVDGVCTSMSLARGTLTNGAWHATVSGVGTDCHHYVFAFKDAGGSEVNYPTTGALTIGDGSAQCPDYSLAPPPGCAGFDRIFVNGFEY